MKLWIRVDAAAPRDPTIAELAAQLGLKVPHALGHCVALWSAMAEHATDGNLARVSDATLETWALWSGQRGRFAAAFRALFTDADTQVVHGWLERQGALLDRMERDRKRHRKPTPPPADPPSSAEVPRNFHGGSTEIPGVSASTVRNGTEQRSKTAEGVPDGTRDSGRSGKPTRAGKAAPWMGRVTEIWTARYSGRPPAYAAKALRPVVAQVGEDEAMTRLARYVAATEGRFASLHKFAETHGEYAPAPLAVPVIPFGNLECLDVLYNLDAPTPPRRRAS